jgi:hypothetical protein
MLTGGYVSNEKNVIIWTLELEDDMKTNVVEIDKTLYKAMLESFGKEILKEKINSFLLSAMEAQLEKYSREILKFEKKYGRTFNEFERMWDEGEIEEKHSNEVEGDFMDWEMMEMEKKEFLTILARGYPKRVAELGFNVIF